MRIIVILKETVFLKNSGYGVEHIMEHELKKGSSELISKLLSVFHSNNQILSTKEIYEKLHQITIENKNKWRKMNGCFRGFGAESPNAKIYKIYFIDGSIEHVFGKAELFRKKNGLSVNKFYNLISGKITNFQTKEN